MASEINGGCIEEESMDRMDILEELSDTIVYTSYKKIAPVTRGHLHFMIGLQRSGKSTWATEWMRGKAREEGRAVFPRAVVCADNIRLAISGQRYNRHIEPVVFMVKDYMIEALLQRGHDVLVDGTHTTKISIRRNFEVDINASWTLINTPKEVCQQRSIHTGQQDLVPVLERSSQQLQKLIDEGIDNVCNSIKSEIKERWPNAHSNK